MQLRASNVKAILSRTGKMEFSRASNATSYPPENKQHIHRVNNNMFAVTKSELNDGRNDTIGIADLSIHDFPQTVSQRIFREWNNCRKVWFTETRHSFPKFIDCACVPPPRTFVRARDNECLWLVQ